MNTRKTEIVKLREAGRNGNRVLTVPFTLKDEIPNGTHFLCEVVDGVITYRPVNEA